MASATSGRDRPAAIRAALRELVAEAGFHGASMSAVATRAGVATGTAYVHYASKDDLVLAAYREAKQALGAAAVAAVEDPPTLREHFVQLWLGAHRHLRRHRMDARFIVQLDSSPWAALAHEQGPDDDPLAAEIDRVGMRAAFIDLPLEVLYELGLAPAVRLAATGDLPDDQLDVVAHACWAAVTSATP